jgi:hypothetical protein
MFAHSALVTGVITCCRSFGVTYYCINQDFVLLQAKLYVERALGLLKVANKTLASHPNGSIYK